MDTGLYGCIPQRLGGDVKHVQNKDTMVGLDSIKSGEVFYIVEGGSAPEIVPYMKVHVITVSAIIKKHSKRACIVNLESGDVFFLDEWEQSRITCVPLKTAVLYHTSVESDVE